MHEINDFRQLSNTLAQAQIRIKELELRNEELTDFIENAAIPLHWVDKHGIVIWANQAELDALGYTREEYIGAPIATFHADQYAISEILSRLENNETLTNYQARLRCKDGSIKHVLISSNVRRSDGEFVHTRCFTRDISQIVLEQERMNELIGQLGESKARLRMATDIVESSFDAIISKKLDHAITSWNKSAEELFGYTAEEMIGKSSLLLVPQEVMEREKQMHLRLERGERIAHFETRRTTKENRVLDVSMTLSPIIDVSGKITGVSKIIRDITERKLDQRRKDDFVAMVSHELKTPLTSILSYIQMLHAKSKKIGDDFGIQTLARTEVQAKRMTQMINDFLDIARLEDARIRLEKTEFELEPLIREVIAEIQVVYISHPILLDACPGIKVYADRGKIGQVFTNLISNAIKYSPAGSDILISCALRGETVEVAVTDHGLGISKENQEKLFERFYRVEDERTRNISGFGIGLYLVSEILHYHNAAIHVTSALNQGSTFSFTMETL